MTSMYAKLMNLKKAELKPRPFTGEEILWYSEGREGLEVPPQVVLEERRGKKAFKRVTEGEFIQVLIKEGRDGLKRLVERILAAKREIELKSKSALNVLNTREEVERAISALGFNSASKPVDSFKHLLKSSASFLDLTVNSKEDGSLEVFRGMEMSKTLSTLDDFFGILCTKRARATLVALGDDEDVLLLLKLRASHNDTTVYSEPIGVYLKSGRIARGADLVMKVARAISNCIGVSEGDFELPLNLKALAISRVRSSFSILLSPLNKYRDELFNSGLRDRDCWIYEHELAFELDPFGCIVLVKGACESDQPPEELKRRIEEEAVKFVLKVEEEEGRIASVVSESEHYDVKSIDPKTGEVREIEVKGHAGSEIYGELTDQEVELAKKERDRYWLYIVYDVKSGSPKLLRFRNPLETMNWKLSIEKRYIFWPKRFGE